MFSSYLADGFFDQVRNAADIAWEIFGAFPLQQLHQEAGTLERSDVHLKIAGGHSES